MCVFPSEQPVLSIEMIGHPLPLLLNKKDNGESTVTVGEWRPAPEGKKATRDMMQPTAQAICIRSVITVRERHVYFFN